ncbi:hypothetical protein DIZ48_16070, partial [Legionella pneumophila]
MAFSLIWSSAWSSGLGEAAPRVEGRPTGSGRRGGEELDRVGVQRDRPAPHDGPEDGLVVAEAGLGRALEA